MNVKPHENLILKGVAIIVGGVVLKKGVIDPILEKAGLKKDDKDKADEKKYDDQDTKLRLTAFNPNYWRDELKKGNTKCLIWEYKYAKSLAKSIYDSNKPWYLPDDEKKAVAEFKKNRSLMHASRLAEVFQQEYKTDLQGFIKSFMWEPTDYVWEVYQYLDGLPVCVTA